MLRRLVFIVVTFAALPLIGLAGFYFYRSDRQAAEARKVEIRSEVELTAAALSEFAQERMNDARLWGQINTARVALDFQRPEGLTQFLNRLTESGSVYSEIVVLDKSFNFFAINENRSDHQSFDELIRSIPTYAEIARKLDGEEALVFLNDGPAPDLFLASVIKDEYQNVVGYFVGHVKNDLIQRYLDRIRRRIGGEAYQDIQAELAQQEFGADSKLNEAEQYRDCAEINIDAQSRLLCLSVPIQFLSSNYLGSFTAVLAGILVLIFFFGFAAKWLIGVILEPIRTLLKLFGEMARGLEVQLVPSSKDPEVREIEENALLVMNRLETYRRVSEAAAAEAATVEVAKQLAHDIRSPLSALDMALSGLDIQDSDVRMIVQSATGRIRNIANDLIHRGKKKRPTFNTEKRPHHLLTLLLLLKGEKEIQFSLRSNIVFDFVYDNSVLNSFVELNGDELSRVLSNVIDNAVESIEGPGRVLMELTRTGSFIKILVSDSGRGIPSDIIKRVGEKGFTHGKLNGSGLGIFYAKLKAEEWGGSLELDSQVGRGTKVSLLIPESKAPPNFLSELSLVAGSQVAIVDDDESVHQSWNRLFKQLALSDRGIEIVHFYEPVKFREWIQSPERSLRDLKVLMDYHFGVSEENGLKLIEELELSEIAVLVTSASEDLKIQSEATRLKTQILPKATAFSCQIRVKES
jgi:signal transduction histidine kinase